MARVSERLIASLDAKQQKASPCGSSICEHGRLRHKCKECGGKGICEHGRERYYCKECGGKGICEHGRRRNTCKECRAGGDTSRTADKKRRQQPAHEASEPAAKRHGQSGATSGEQAAATPADAAPLTVKTETLNEQNLLAPIPLNPALYTHAEWNRLQHAMVGNIGRTQHTMVYIVWTRLCREAAREQRGLTGPDQAPERQALDRILDCWLNNTPPRKGTGDGHQQWWPYDKCLKMAALYGTYLPSKQALVNANYHSENVRPEDWHDSKTLRKNPVSQHGPPNGPRGGLAGRTAAGAACLMQMAAHAEPLVATACTGSCTSIMTAEQSAAAWAALVEAAAAASHATADADTELQAYEQAADAFLGSAGAEQQAPSATPSPTPPLQSAPHANEDVDGAEQPLSPGGVEQSGRATLPQAEQQLPVRRTEEELIATPSPCPTSSSSAPSSSNSLKVRFVTRPVDECDEEAISDREDCAAGGPDELATGRKPLPTRSQACRSQPAVRSLSFLSSNISKSAQLAPKGNPALARARYRPAEVPQEHWFAPDREEADNHTDAQTPNHARPPLSKTTGWAPSHKEWNRQRHIEHGNTTENRGDKTAHERVPTEVEIGDSAETEEEEAQGPPQELNTDEFKEGDYFVMVPPSVNAAELSQRLEGRWREAAATRVIGAVEQGAADNYRELGEMPARPLTEAEMETRWGLKIATDGVLNEEQRADLVHLLNRYPEVWLGAGRTIPPATHIVPVTVELLKYRPRKMRPYRIKPEYLDFVRSELQTMYNEGMIEAGAGGQTKPWTDPEREYVSGGDDSAYNQ